MKLIYIGQSSLPGVPARDLSETEIPFLPFTPAELIASGLYKSDDEPELKKKSKIKEVTNERN